MNKLFVVLFVSAMVSLGVTFPGLMSNHPDSLIVPFDEEVELSAPDAKAGSPIYGMPNPDGEPLPPPPDDDEPILAELDP